MPKPPMPPDLQYCRECGKVIGPHKDWFGPECMCHLPPGDALRGAHGAGSSRANANDRLPRASLGRVEGGDGIVEGRDGANVCPQTSVPHPLDDLAQLGTIGLDNEV